MTQRTPTRKEEPERDAPGRVERRPGTPAAGGSGTKPGGEGAWGRIRRQFGKWGKWLVTVGLVALVVAVVDLGEVYATLRSADAGPLGVALAFTLGDRLLMAGKWFPLLRIQLPDVGLARAVRAYFAASFAALLLPASVGGDVLRAVGLGRDREAVVEVGASVALERVLGLAGSGLVALAALWVALAADIPMGFLVPWALACVGAGVVAAVVPFSPRARRGLAAVLARFEGRRGVDLLQRFGSAYGAYEGHPWTLVAVGVLSALEQVVPVFTFWAAAWALGLEVSFEALFVAAPLTVFAARMPISVAGIGILEGGLVYLLGLFGVPGAQALSLALVGRAVELVALLPGAFWWTELSGEGTGVSATRSESPSSP